MGAVAEELAPRRMPSGVGGPNGVGRLPFDRWFRYPAGFSPRTLDLCFETAQLDRGDLLLEPFAGSATAGTAAVRRGLRFRGLEAHPLVAELGRLKFERPGDPDDLLHAASHVVSAPPATNVGDEPSMIRQSFALDVLGALVGMRDAVLDTGPSPWSRHLKWGLLGTLRDCAAVKVGWPYQRPGQARVPRMVDPRAAFLRRISWMADDLTIEPNASDAELLTGDARQQKSFQALMGDRLAAGVITSPPYLNNFDYADATRLELYFWGTARSWFEMVEVVRSGMLVATTQQSRVAYADASSRLLEAASPAAWPEIQDRLSKLKAERALRPRGKEYDLLVASYFGDMIHLFKNMAQYLEPNAPVLIVIGDSAPYGVYVDTPRIVASIAEGLNFGTVGTVDLRRRGLRWHSNGSRHAVELKESLVILRSPRGR